MSEVPLQAEVERWTCRPVARCVATCTRENVPAPITCWQAPRYEQLRRNVKRFQRGLVLKDQRLWYHLTLGSRVMKKKTRRRAEGFGFGGEG